MVRQLALLTMSLLVAAPALAQSAQVPAPPQQKPIVIENAVIHPRPGETIEGPAFIVFENGRIAQIGQGPAPEIPGAQRFNADGLHVYPSLISTDTTLGLTETASVDVTLDMRELGDFTPEVRAVVAVNPDSDLLPVTRANGIMLGLTFPTGGIISGRCSIIRYDGWTWEEMAITPEAGLVINWPRTEPAFFGRGSFRPEGEGGSPADRFKETMKKIDDFFDEASAYLKAKEANPSLNTDLRFEAMRSTLEGRTPVYVRANSAGQIESAVAWSLKRGLRIIIVGGSEADEAAAVLKKHDIPVIIGGTHRVPTRRHDAYDDAFTLPARLYEAGVRFAIASGAETAHERDLNHVAATAAAYGLPRHEALRAVTLSAAEILGIADQYGSLESGKSATLIVTTGDPLEITSDTLMAFIDGRNIDLGSRHKRLYDKYLEKYRQLGIIE
ncbi:MAG: amidohydrolase family protein [Phycisphaeraceae bacterium]|nr:amidohydrolase family protein [Phycisphaerales bacterium]QOJ17092.1 MAG: amidohydrolase family protein [Phycisphaeraceae bacterium]